MTLFALGSIAFMIALSTIVSRFDRPMPFAERGAFSPEQTDTCLMAIGVHRIAPANEAEPACVERPQFFVTAIGFDVITGAADTVRRLFGGFRTAAAEGRRAWFRFAKVISNHQEHVQRFRLEIILT